MLALQMAGPGNQHCASCIGTLSSRMLSSNFWTAIPQAPVNVRTHCGEVKSARHGEALHRYRHGSTRVQVLLESLCPAAETGLHRLGRLLTGQTLSHHVTGIERRAKCNICVDLAAGPGRCDDRLSPLSLIAVQRRSVLVVQIYHHRLVNN